MKIESKNQMYDLLKAGEFGNTFRTWPSIEAAFLDNYFGPYGMRTSITGGPMYPGDMSLKTAINAEEYCLSLNPEFIIIYEAVPNHLITMNAEIFRCPLGLYLRYKEGPGHMRAAMAICDHATMLDAILILQKHIDYDGFNHLVELVDKYEGISSSESCIVEFATFSEPVGPQQKKYVIWEVRSY